MCFYTASPSQAITAGHRGFKYAPINVTVAPAVKTPINIDRVQFSALLHIETFINLFSEIKLIYICYYKNYQYFCNHKISV